MDSGPRRWLRRWRLAAGSLLALLVWSAPAPSQPLDPPPPHGGPPHGRPPHGRHGPPLEALFARRAEELGLGEETLARIRAIVEESRASTEQGRAELDAAHRAMRDLLDDDVPDEARVMEQAERIGALEIRHRQQRLAAMLAIRALLSDAQRDELIRLRKESGPRSRRARGTPLGPCAPDLAELCPEARPGPPALRCLAERWSDLSRPCQTFVEQGRPMPFRP